MSKADAPAPDHLLRLTDGLEILLRFHDREVDGAFMGELHAHAVPAQLADLFVSRQAREAAAALRDALDEIGPDPAPERLSALAAEYADIYLTHGYRAAPTGSVWLTDDHIERQLPMFEVREWYAHYDISVPDWRKRSDDHVVHELQFVIFLLRAATASTLLDAGRFLDRHVLPWLPAFAVKAAGFTSEPAYGAMLALTAAGLEELRDLLEETTGEARKERVLQAPDSERRLEEDQPYMPGLAESW